MGRAVLMDWDNTIRRGWTIRDWALHLKERGLIAVDAAANVEAVLQRYAAGHCNYTAMATTVLEALAEGLKGQSVAAVAAQAPVFIEQDRENLYPFAGEALREFRARGLSLIIVSGAPEEVLDAAAQKYGFARVLGSVFDMHDGEYVGTVGRNRATVDGKRNAVTSLLAGRVAALAIGDSEADMPLLERARLKIIVGDRELAESVPGSLFIEPQCSDISALLSAVDAT